MPTLVTPPETAFNAYSICTSFPEGEKVVSEKLYLSAITCFGLKKRENLQEKQEKRTRNLVFTKRASKTAF